MYVFVLLELVMEVQKARGFLPAGETGSARRQPVLMGRGNY